MDIGKEGASLLKEMRQKSTLPPYNDLTVQSIIKEIQGLYYEIEKGMQKPELLQDAKHTIALAVNFSIISRDKRCLLAYIKARLDRIEKFRWNLGRIIPDPIKQQMSIAERDYWKSYSSLIGGYIKKSGMDLTSDLKPPKELFIEVRCLKPTLGVITENGIINMKKNMTLYLKRSDVEAHIYQGELKQII